MSKNLKSAESVSHSHLDLLADVLSGSHRGIVYERLWYAGSWGLRFDAAVSCGFHVVTAGRLYLRVAGETYALSAGDVALLSAGYVVASDPAAEALPFTRERVLGLAVGEGEGEACMLSGAYLLYTDNHPVFSNLPPLVLLRAGRRDPSIDALIGLLDGEFRARAPGMRTVVSRYIDAMLICILRHWIERGEPAERGWIRALRDPVLARALALVHSEYRRAWTLQTLARACGASRATLARNFAAEVGVPPMRFLAQRRLGVAKGLMERTAMTLDEIAEQVGYGSSFALSKAFKREFGASPTHLVSR